jgi:hypothetical protein
VTELPFASAAVVVPQQEVVLQEARARLSSHVLILKYFRKKTGENGML